MFELAETAEEISGEGEEGQEEVLAMLSDIRRTIEHLSLEIQGNRAEAPSVEWGNFLLF